MILDLIENQLADLEENSQKHIEPSLFQQIRPNLQPETKRIKTPHVLSARSWNTILESDRLIQAVNESSYDDKLLDTLFSAPSKDASEYEQIIDLSCLPDLYDYLVKMEEKGDQRYYIRCKLTELLLETALYVKIYGEVKDWKRFENALCRVQYDYGKYQKLEKERILYLFFLMQNYTYFVDDYQHFTQFKMDISFFEAVYKKIESRCENSENIISSLEKTLLHAENKEEFKTNFLQFLEQVTEGKRERWLQQLFPNQKSILLEREVKKLLQNIEIDTENVYQIIYPNQSQGNILRMLDKIDKDYLIPFVKEQIQKKKKALLRLIDEHFDVFVTIPEESWLFCKEFQQVVNLNTLNQDNLQDLVHFATKESHKKSIRLDVPLTFAEFQWLQQTSEIAGSVFYRLMDLSVGERLRLCRELPALTMKDVFFEDKKKLIEKLEKLLRTGTLHQHIQSLQLSLKESTTLQEVTALLHREALSPYFSQMKTGGDVVFALRNLELVRQSQSFQHAKITYFEQDEKYQYLIRNLNIQDAFIDKYRANLIDFCQRELHEVFYGLQHNNDMKETQLKNLELITKAQIAGKLKEIKFASEDYTLEIGMSLDQKTKGAWEKNLRAKVQQYTIEETYDYETTIRLGERPVSTCQHWGDGSYSQSLLSNFDTNKKILIAKDGKGRIVSRAIVRLTKIADEKIRKAGGILTFKDVETLDKDVKKEQKSKTNEQLAIFLERTYTSLDDSQSEWVKKKFIELIREKAKEMNAIATFTREYVDEIETKSSNEMYMFISRSKNGVQYLDSLGGSQTQDQEGKYVRVRLFL